MGRTVTIAIAFICLQVNTGCRNSIEEELPVCTISFEKDLSHVFASNCAISGCHVTGFDNGDFSDYLGIKESVDNGQIWFRVAVIQDMPPLNKLFDTDLENIKTWIREGAKLN